MAANANSVNLDVMKTITQQEVNKACHSRSYAQIDDMLGRVKLELILAEDMLAEIVSNGNSPTRQQLFHVKVIKANIDRLERRARDLVERNAKRADKMREQKERLDMALAIVKDRAKEKAISQQLTEAKNKVTEEDLKSFNDPYYIEYKRLHDLGLSADEITAEFKRRESAADTYSIGSIQNKPVKPPSVEDAFVPDENGEVEL